MKFLSFLILVASSLPRSSAHYFFPHLIVNGNFTGYFEYVREDTQGYMPFKNGYTSTDLRCNTGSQDFASQTGTYAVKAGDTIGFGTDFNALIAHPGPMQVYMSKAPGDVRDYDGSGDWFKIYELGPEEFGSDGIQWGATGTGNFTFTLPKETPAGQYLVRIEHMGLHGAGDFGGAEFFFNCAQIEVESDSTAVPSPVVQIPGLYDGYEPGILFYMYRDYIVNYTMPGPVPWPIAIEPNVTAAGVTVAPTDAVWTLPAVSQTLTGAATSASTAESTSSTPTSTTSTSASTLAMSTFQTSTTAASTAASTSEYSVGTTSTSSAFTSTSTLLPHHTGCGRSRRL